MSSEQHHEAEENDGLLRAIGERECWMAGRQNRWSAVNNADINYQSDAWCAVSRADPADFRGDSKRETRRVRNNLVEWRAEPSVSGLISLAHCISTIPVPLLRFSPSRSFRCSSIILWHVLCKSLLFFVTLSLIERIAITFFINFRLPWRPSVPRIPHTCHQQTFAFRAA